MINQLDPAAAFQKASAETAKNPANEAVLDLYHAIPRNFYENTRGTHPGERIGAAIQAMGLSNEEFIDGVATNAPAYVDVGYTADWIRGTLKPDVLQEYISGERAISHDHVTLFACFFETNAPMILYGIDMDAVTDSALGAGVDQPA